jgi:hypothetical protein
MILFSAQYKPQTVTSEALLLLQALLAWEAVCPEPLRTLGTEQGSCFCFHPQLETPVPTM